MKLCLQKKVRQLIFFSPLFYIAVLGSRIRDPGAEIRDPRSGINIPDPQHCLEERPLNDRQRGHTAGGGRGKTDRRPSIGVWNSPPTRNKLKEGKRISHANWRKDWGASGVEWCPKNWGWGDGGMGGGPFKWLCWDGCKSYYDQANLTWKLRWLHTCER